MNNKAYIKTNNGEFVLLQEANFEQVKIKKVSPEKWKRYFEDKTQAINGSTNQKCLQLNSTSLAPRKI